MIVSVLKSRPAGKSFAPALLLTASFAFSGCAAIPDLGLTPQVKPVAAYAAGESFQAPAAQWPADRWWASYGDAQLAALIEDALAGAPDLAQAEARLRQADAAQRQTGAALKPQLTAKGQVTSFALDSSDGSNVLPQGWNDISQGSLNFSYEFDFWGKNRAALAAATSKTDAARAELQAARLMLATSVASAYADLAQLYSDRDAAEDAVRVRARTRELMSGRLAQGLENDGAAKRAQAAQAGAEADLARIDEALALNRNRIAALLGQGPDRGLTIARPAIPALSAFGLPENLQAELIGRRPDVVAARLRAEAASHRMESAKADFYPNVNVTALLGVNSLGLNNLPRSALSYAAVGPAISLPIFEGGRIEGAYRGARAEYDEAVASYDDALAQALKDIADIAVSARALQSRLGKSREALAASSDAYGIADNRYRGGLATYLDVLTAEDSLIANRRTVADLETRAFALDVALVRALGGGFHL